MSRTPEIVRRSIVAVGLLLWCVRAAAAQAPIYVTGNLFADIKRFGSFGGASFDGSEELSLDGTSLGEGLRVGTFLSPRWSIELAIDVGGRTSTSLPNPFVGILALYPSLRTVNLKASTKFVAIGTLVGFHPPAQGRVRLGYLGGFTFVRATYSADYPDFPIPLATPTVPPPGIVTFLPPVIVIHAQTQTDHTKAVILGVEAAIAVTPHMAVVPEIRALAFSTIEAGPGVFLIRPGVGVRWNF